MKALAQFFSVAAFEVRYQLRNPVLWVSFGLFFLLTFASVTIDQIQIGGIGNVNVNAPDAILQTTMVMTLLALFAVTAFVANSVLRDDETGYGPILRATRLGKGAYLSGRFTGAYLAAMIGILAVPVAMLIGSFMPWLDQEKVGPTILAHYAYAYFVLAAPMMFIFGAMLFACATMTRSMMGAYVCLVAILVAWGLMGTFLDKPELADLGALLDPTGVAALTKQTRYWTANDRNTRLPEIVGAFWQNRALWMTVGFAFLGLAFLAFKPGSKSEKPARGKKAAEASVLPSAVKAPLTSPSLTSTVRRAQLWARTLFDVKAVLFSPAFIVLLMIGLLNSIGSLLFANEVRGTDIEPVTRLMVSALNGAFGIIPIIIAGFYAGDLVWRDRERKMAEIIDATPVSDWAFVLPKVLAIVLVLIATTIIGMLAGMAVQLFKGHSNLEPIGYLLWWILPMCISAAQLGILAIFFQALSPNKYAGWGLLVLYLVSRLVMSRLGFQHNLYQFGASPGTPLTDFNGMAHFWVARTWFDLYWGAFCVILVVLAYGLWSRGAETRLKPRLQRFPSRLRGITGAVLASGVVAFVGLGSWIFYNTNVLNIYQSSLEGDKRQADMEKALAQYEQMVGPKITDVKLNVALRPKDRQADITGSYVIQNQTDKPLDRVLVVRPSNENIPAQTFTLASTIIEKDWPQFSTTLFKFQTPMQPGEKRTLSFTATYGRLGFGNRSGQKEVIGNGTFMNNASFSPTLGVSRGNWIDDRAKRRKYGLDPDRRPFKLEDPRGDTHHYLRPDSHWVNADITVSTDDDQIPIAPGYQVSETKSGGRITRRFVTEAPMHHFFSIQSARYNVRRSVVQIAEKPVSVELYYHPTHTANLARMEKAAQTSLTLFSQRFSNYQFRQFRILEFPAYATFAQSFANTVPFSEDIGWLQLNKDPKKIDLVTFVTAHEIAHQWFAHQFVGGEKQGSTMLSETFSQYGAMLVLEQLLGPDQVRQFLKNELDNYLSSRGSEAVEELPLARVENQAYIHYNKGALVMYFLRNEVGETAVNNAIKRIIDQFAFKPAPYPTSAQFITFLRQEVGNDAAKQQLITDLFEKITVYDAKTTQATKVKLPDGRWQVTLNIEAKKFYADGEGKETEVAMNEPWEIGVFTKKPEDEGFSRANVITIERKPIVSGQQKIVMVVGANQEPAFAGVDPYLKRIDRDSDDNLVAVKAP